MPPVRQTTGRATRRRRRPNYRDRSSVRSPPVLITDGIHAELCVALLQISKDSANATITFTEVHERSAIILSSVFALPTLLTLSSKVRANADAYGREIIRSRMTPCVGREILALDTRGIINNEFESETLQITPAGRRKFAAIEADAEGAVASDPSEGATLAALFGASRVRMGLGQMGRALDEKDRTIDELRDRLRRRDQGKLQTLGLHFGLRELAHRCADGTSRRTGSLQHTIPVPTPGSFVRALPPDVVRRVDELQLLRLGHPAGPAGPEANAQVRTPRRLSGAKSMPYPSPESPSTSASASIYAPRQTNDAEVQCDPSETETQLADVQAELLEAQANYAQAVQTIVELKDQIRTLSSQQQTWNANKAELEAEVRVLREAEIRAEMAKRLWSATAARLAAETTGF
ncbi:hypothetical protein B0H14DRAFT_3494251 [Mycena olivaceomarginata]|nr:hypothetical protein B0H14DRAFT_3494251 [Mycena olivaceomarginata]